MTKMFGLVQKDQLQIHYTDKVEESYVLRTTKRERAMKKRIFDIARTELEIVWLSKHNRLRSVSQIPSCIFISEHKIYYNAYVFICTREIIKGKNRKINKCNI